MYLEIITPEQTLFKGDVESILFPGSHGDFQVLNDHAPIVSNLTKGKVKIIGKMAIQEDVKDRFEFNEKQTILEIDSGTVEMNNNQVTLLVD
ncbi:F0F1 ATP synthase subunit epsilon [Flavobacteriaceae bacterium]|jgi:F-type H+-transporting ATPase subunit epsilon|nr:F0F1 ATP synthase subunit epsilon [Flavobacteriaceae bacterium]MDA9882749.1 F0F1 ATP synthase subunit epsilon [Flavobacteriaceae bacterium]MDC1010232.1 F0F1 ATP synthase subunit epsilon [Flavobacteriaceae bacterium]